MPITVTTAGGDGGLSSLVYDPTNNVTNLTQTQAAQDANFSINGFAATSPSNVVSGAISGVTLEFIAGIGRQYPDDADRQPRHDRGANLDRHVRHGLERRAEQHPKPHRL